MVDDAYLTLALVPGVGTTRLQRLLERFGTAAGALEAPIEELVQAGGMTRTVATAIAATDRDIGRAALASVARMGGRTFTFTDPGYPALLRTISDPPPVLFAKGDLDLLTRPAVAIVGSRDHTQYGAEVTRAIAQAAAGLGLVVVSGMARGLDAIAHQAALDADGPTLGVLGTGLDLIYPAANRELFERVAARGLLLTEFLPGEPPHAASFPRRNRLISGLARVTVVVEAAHTSGALRTAECAQNQGREVLAVPGPITSPISAGTNALIRDGATPLLELRDLMDHYPEVAAPEPAVGSPWHVSQQVRALLTALRKEPLPAERLVDRCGIPVAEALAVLSTLELRGLVRQVGGFYRAAAQGLFQ